MSGHGFEHEVATACALGIFGSIDPKARWGHQERLENLVNRFV